MENGYWRGRDLVKGCGDFGVILHTNAVLGEGGQLSVCNTAVLFWGINEVCLKQGGILGWYCIPRLY